MRRTVMMATLAGALVFVLAAAFGFSPDEDMASARRAFRVGDMDQAMRLARRAAFFGSDGRDALLLTARAAAELNNSAYAVKVLGRVIANDPEHVPALLARGRLRMDRGNLVGALDDFNAGLERVRDADRKWPRSVAGYLARRGVVLFELGRIDAARRDAGAALALGGNDPWPHLLASRLLEKSGRLLEALEAHEKALALLRARDGIFFLAPEYKGLTGRLVLLRRKANVGKERPLLPGL